MNQEIERKFLVTGEGWRTAAGHGTICCQGYITGGASGATVRVRLLGNQGFLTVKGPTCGISRSEFEYEIPVADAEYMIEHLCGDRLVSKKRYRIESSGMIWEVDEFSGLNEGLIIAEIELESEAQSFDKPEWVGTEITSDSRYVNAVLARHPFSSW